MSARTIRRRLREVGIRPYCGSRLTPRHRRMCRDFARRHKRWPLQRWHSVLFTDECKFQDRRQYVYRRSNERFTDAYFKERDRFGGASTMVWAGFTYHRKMPLVLYIYDICDTTK